MSRNKFVTSTLVISVYVIVATIVQQVVTMLGGAATLQEIPNWAFLLIGPMIPLGIGHGIEFFLLASMTCLPLLICGLVWANPWTKRWLLVAAAAIWIGIGYFLGH